MRKECTHNNSRIPAPIGPTRAYLMWVCEECLNEYMSETCKDTYTAIPIIFRPKGISGCPDDLLENAMPRSVVARTAQRIIDWG